MEPFVYAADPQTALRMYNSAYLEQVNKAKWRNARHVEELHRSMRATGRSHASAKEYLAERPRATRRVPWLSWRGVLGSLHLVGASR